MVFVSGVHGVGKSYFCGILKERLNISSYTASSLISGRKKARFSTDKRVADIDVNQLYLLEAVKELKDRNEEFLLDGHFCLLDSVYLRSSQNSQPNSDASDVNSRKERGRVFRIARSDPPPAF